MMEVLKNNMFLNNILITCICIFCGFAAKRFLYKDRKKYNNLVRNKISQTINTAIVIFLLFVWLYEYKEALFSMVAIAAAIVVAFKEVIMCFTGGLLLSVSSSCDVGDRIEVGDVRGFVLERGLLSVKLFEIGPERYSQQATGDVITLPNSMFLSNPVKNESYFNGISIKTFKFLILPAMNREVVESDLLAYANELCSDYIDNAKSVLTKFCHKEHINIPTLDPRIKLTLIDDKLYLLLKMPVVSELVAEVEQKLIRKFADHMDSSQKTI